MGHCVMSNDKKAFRKKAILELGNINNHFILNKKIINSLKIIILELEKSHSIQDVLFYMPFGFEADILPLMREYRKKYNCFIPFIQDVSFKMIPFRYPFVNNRFGIKEGFNSLFYKKKLDLMIVPILGYDIANKRIGFGKGMYDRFFSNLKKKPIVVFVQLKNIFSKEMITEDFDIKFDIYISPKIIIKRVNNANKHCNYRFT